MPPDPERPPEGATAAPKAKLLLAAAFPVQSLLKAALSEADAVGQTCERGVWNLADKSF